MIPKSLAAWINDFPASHTPDAPDSLNAQMRKLELISGWSDISIIVGQRNTLLRARSRCGKHSVEVVLK